MRRGDQRNQRWRESEGYWHDKGVKKEKEDVCEEVSERGGMESGGDRETRVEQHSLGPYQAPGTLLKMHGES